jgi:cytochrome c biogenesis protein CcdA
MLLRLAGIAISIGLADSLNPSTLGPALFLATTQRPARRVALFTLGVFAVNLVAGIVLTLGPGRLLLGLIPRPDQTVRHVIELVAGVALVGAAVALLVGRRKLARRSLPMRSSGGGGSAFVAGVSIAAVELPTAVPYFAVIAAIVASDANVLEEIALVTLYCAAFVLPLIAIVVVLLVAGERADPWLQRAGAWVRRRWPVVLATLLLLVGGALVLIGGAGLVGDRA